MFNLFKKKTAGEKIEIKIDGMHCTSCSMNVDGELEDLDGVISAGTSYAKSISVVEYDPQKVTRGQIEDTIKNLGYKIK